MMTASSVASQSQLDDIKLEYWLKRLNRSSSLAALCNGLPLSMWQSCVKVMVSMTSFTATSCNLGILDWVFDFFCRIYFSPILPRKHFIKLTVDEMSSPGLTCLDA